MLMSTASPITCQLDVKRPAPQSLSELGKIAAMRLWQLNLCIVLLIGLVFIGARLIAPAPARKWAECAKPSGDDMVRKLCAEFR